MNSSRVEPRLAHSAANSFRGVRDVRVEPVEEVVDVGVDYVAVGVHVVKNLRVRLVLAETAHLVNCRGL